MLNGKTIVIRDYLKKGEKLMRQYKPNKFLYEDDYKFLEQQMQNKQVYIKKVLILKLWI